MIKDEPRICQHKMRNQNNNNRRTCGVAAAPRKNNYGMMRARSAALRGARARRALTNAISSNRKAL